MKQEKIFKNFCRAWWLIPVIPAIREVEIGRIMVQG
jgi:hypothetical protein